MKKEETIEIIEKYCNIKVVKNKEMNWGKRWNCKKKKSEIAQHFLQGMEMN